MKKRNKVFIGLWGVAVFFIGLILLFKEMTLLKPPTIPDRTIEQAKVIQMSDSLWTSTNSWLHKNTNGVWELSIKGTPFELGVENGKLTKKLAEKQEDAFFGFIKGIIPSNSALHFLKYFIAWFNKDLDDYVPMAIRQEIYGISLYAPEKYHFIAPNYHRVLNYHAAHDIGHTVQNMNLIGCTAFGLKGDKTVDGHLLIGRNFDFSAGDAFARDKLVTFCNPDSGYAFMYVSWAGMMGVLSGMNEYGLTVTLNSAKSAIPTSAKMPVCIVSRLILQHARNIKEAFDIVKQFDTFVSEMFFIGSASDGRCAVIDKSINETALYEKPGDKVILTNFFQSDKLKDTKLNLEAINEGSSMYRYQRVEELLSAKTKFSVEDVSKVLRDKKGIGGCDIGLGNEKAVNQLICHHSIIFKPEDRLVWVSDYPYQIGAYKCYDLNAAFKDHATIKDIYKPEWNIKPDSFLYSKEFIEFKEYKSKCILYKNIVEDEICSVSISNDEIEKFIALNPSYYYTHYLAALLYKKRKDIGRAKSELIKAMSLECPRLVDRKQVEEVYNQVCCDN